MSREYGATGESVRSGTSGLRFDLYEDDDDYDYLIIPDEDFLDSADGKKTTDPVPKRIAFSAVHDPPQPFDGRTKSCFMPGQKISVSIIKVERSDSSYFMNPFLYHIQVEHGVYKWTVCRRYKHFNHLHNELSLLRTKALLTVPTKDARERRKTIAKSQAKVTTFPKKPEPMMRAEQLEERKRQLEEYLNSVLKCSQYRNHPEMLKFLEVSSVSFVSETGGKLKEGLVDKQAGGRRVSLGFFSCFLCCQTNNWQERWLIVKDSYVAYMKPSNGMVRDVILMDRDFSVKVGSKDTGISNGVLISNMSRHLLLKAYTDRKAQEWYTDLQKAIKLCGDDYMKPNRHDSFAPVRLNSYVNWFVDGASYMAAVADAIEAAKQEIFITDWMLSPELYLKRPNMEKDKDKWRLDLLLQRKAMAGVKIFILVYKEIEMAIGINSYYTKKALMEKHPNIIVLRHPDGIKLWSHHEKCVVVDQRLAFLGGIDLCYGRWDTRKHRLTDYGQVLTNIYGTQDNDTLENVLSNKPNILPKISQLLAKAQARQENGNLEPIAEVSLDPAGITLEENPAHGNTDFDTAEIGSEESPGVGSVEDKLVKVFRDMHGAYNNPGHVGTPSGGSPITERKGVGEDVGGGDNNSQGKSDSQRKKKASHAKTDSQGSASLFGKADLDGSGSGVVPSHSSDVTSDLDEELPNTLGKFLKNFVDKRREIQANINNTAQPGFADLGLKHGRTINEETAAIQGDRSGHLNPDMPRITQQDRDRMRDQLLNVFGNLRSSFGAVGTRQDSVIEEGAGGRKSKAYERGVSVEKPARRESGGAKDRPQNTEQKRAGNESGFSNAFQKILRSVSTVEKNDENGNTAGNVNTGGIEMRDNTRQAELLRQVSQPKPTTPPQKRKMGFKTVAKMNVMLAKADSIDVTDDTTARPWDESVYRAREIDTRDQDMEAKLTNSGLGESLKIWVGKDYVNFIFKDFVDLDNPFTDFVDRTVTPRMPWHDIGAAVFGKPARDVARHFIQRWNFTKLQKNKTSDVIPMLLPKSNEIVSVPRWASRNMFCCNCQILRSSCEWSAGIKWVEKSILNSYIDLIENSKHYIYIENQFFITINHDKVVENGIATALYERIVRAHKNGETFRVYVILPLLPGFEGQLGTSTGTSIQAVTHWNYQSICRGGDSLLERLAEKGMLIYTQWLTLYGRLGRKRLNTFMTDPFEYISFYGLRKHDEMLETLVTELVYVHSKLMIVDDSSVIIASANINDRSMLGYRDSELGILVQDTRSVDSLMNGKPFKAGAFASSLRKSLFREHIGVESNSEIDVSDPISDHFYKKVWLKIASINTDVYDKVFRCLPNDDVMKLSDIHDYEQQPKLCHTDPKKARELLKKIKGHLVFLPLSFLGNDNLTPAAGTKEALAPTVIWT